MLGRSQAKGLSLDYQRNRRKRGWKIQARNGHGQNNDGESESDGDNAEIETTDGVAERVNRTLLEGATTVLIQAKLPSCFWPFAVKHVAYVRNRIPHSATGQIPYSIFTKQTPSMKHVRVFGCKAYVLKQPKTPKLGPRAYEGIYLESLDHGVYRVLVTSSSEIPFLVESRHVTFDESLFPGAAIGDEWESNENDSDSTYSSQENAEDMDTVELSDLEIFESEPSIDSENSSDLEENDSGTNFEDSGNDGGETGSNHEMQVESSQEDNTESRRYPLRTRRKPTKWYEASSANVVRNVAITTGDDPSLREALNATSEEKELWMTAIEEEFQSLHENNTWHSDEFPAHSPLPTHPVLKIKRRADGSVERFKVRIVAGGTFKFMAKTIWRPMLPLFRLRLFVHFCTMLYRLI